MKLRTEKTPEQIARKEAEIAQSKAIEAQRRLDGEARKREEEAERVRAAFAATPAGRARAAFKEGDQVFQYSIDVMDQRAIVHSLASLAPTGVKTKTRSTDPTGVLNTVADEGWELVNGSFVFLETGETSRKQLMSSKVQASIAGTVMGFYLFKRCETNRRTSDVHA
jgi:hypothetical protein